jgi:dethiobiotin synthetase/adenosylmethionine--8-amino-7-oxononanoate aminotransferase
MPLLFPNLRITQVFGGASVCRGNMTSGRLCIVSANTDVGKTLLTTALLRASASQYATTPSSPGKSEQSRMRVFYLKPVSTGSDDEADVK